MDSAQEIETTWLCSRINLLCSRYYDLLTLCSLCVDLLVSFTQGHEMHDGSARCRIGPCGGRESGVMGLLGLRFMTCVGMEV